MSRFGLFAAARVKQSEEGWANFYEVHFRWRASPRGGGGVSHLIRIRIRIRETTKSGSTAVCGGGFAKDGDGEGVGAARARRARTPVTTAVRFRREIM